MACFESRTVIRLASREAITLPDVRGATLRVTRGALWLTQEDDRKDIVLRAGDNWVVEADGDTVVEAQDAVKFSIIGRPGATLELPPQRKSVSGTWSLLAALRRPVGGAWSLLAGLFTPPPRDHALYARYSRDALLI